MGYGCTLALELPTAATASRTDHLTKNAGQRVKNSPQSSLHPSLGQRQVKAGYWWPKQKIWQATKIHLHSFPSPYRCYLNRQISHRCYLCFLIACILLTEIRRIRNTRFPQELCLQKSHILFLLPCLLQTLCCPFNSWPHVVGLQRHVAVPKKPQQKPPRHIKELHWPLSSALGLNSSSFSSSSLLELSVFPFICSNWSKLTRPISSKLRLTFERNASVSTQHNHQPTREMATYPKQNRAHPKACSARGDMQPPQSN